MPDRDEIRDPLPIAAEEGALQRESLIALTTVLPPRRFIFRQETQDDHGVDGTIEVLDDGRATNCRAHAQVKARSGLRAAADGSYPLEVRVTNLNYLANGTSPIYVLYRAEDGTLWYTWARDELGLVERDNPDWRRQQTVTIHFRHRLNSEASSLLAERILDEASLARRFADTTRALLDVTRPVALLVDPATGVISTPAEAVRALRENGLQLVSLGRVQEVLDLGRILGSSEQTDSRVALALAYAHYSQGRHLLALASLDGVVASNDLTAEERSLRDFVRCSSELLVGLIDDAEFKSRLEAWQRSAPPALAMQYTLQSTWLEIRDVTDRTHRREMQGRFTQTLEAAVRDSLHPVITLVAHRYSLEIAAEWLSADILRLVAFSGRQGALSWQTDTAELLPGAMTRWSSWEEAVQDACKQARSIGHEPLALAFDLLLERGRVGLHAGIILASPAGRTEPPPIDGGLPGRIQAIAARARSLSEVEIETRAHLLAADAFELLGETSQAVDEAQAALSSARSLRLRDVAEKAEKVISGTSTFREAQAQIVRARQSDPMERIEVTPDGELEDHARTLCSAMGIPEDRWPILVGEIRVAQMLARAQRKFCRHLQYLEHLEQRRSRLTYYATTPNKVCRCALFGHQSVLGHTDFDRVLHAFQASWCAECTAQSPRGAAQQTA